MSGSTGTYDVVVIGGGIIGLVTAWRTAQRGAAVGVIDPDPGRGAAWVAAGMLTPVTEAAYGEDALLRLGLASWRRYPDFVAELHDATGLPTGFRDDGTLEVAYDADDLAVLEEVDDYRRSLGLPGRRLDARECREVEPMLAPAVRGGVLVEDDGSVDPRLLCAALLAAARAAGVELIPAEAGALVTAGDRVRGVRLETGPATGPIPGPGPCHTVHAPAVVLAAGARSADLPGVPPRALPPVRPVKGEVLRLRGPAGWPARSVRGLVRGSPVYLVPRRDGEVVVGATQEEAGYDTRVSAGGVWRLLRDARELLPTVTELELTGAIAGLRPGSPDNAPLIGATALPGLYAATGHYRNGVLLAPITGELMAELLGSGRAPDLAHPFAPSRFEGAGVPCA